MPPYRFTRSHDRPSRSPLWSLTLAAGLATLAACSSAPKTSQSATPQVDPRIGLRRDSTLAFYGAVASAFAIVALFFGQRMAKDYAGAATLVPYFLLTLAAIYLLALV